MEVDVNWNQRRMARELPLTTKSSSVSPEGTLELNGCEKEVKK
jgi:hypothetical protein